MAKWQGMGLLIPRAQVRSLLHQLSQFRKQARLLSAPSGFESLWDYSAISDRRGSLEAELRWIQPLRLMGGPLLYKQQTGVRFPQGLPVRHASRQNRNTSRLATKQNELSHGSLAVAFGVRHLSRRSHEQLGY